ncbi:hypothetical protein GCM10028820_06190 [Tessaracoccus terricola]
MTASARTPRTRRAAVVVFLVVFCVGLGWRGAAALWAQESTAEASVSVGTWAESGTCESPTSGELPPGQLSSTFGWGQIKDGHFTLMFHQWSGQAVGEVEFCQDGASLGMVRVDPDRAYAEVQIDGLPDGTYEFTYLVRTSAGEVRRSQPLVITVTEAKPGTPTLRYDSSAKILYVNLYQGTPATSYRILQDGVEITSGGFAEDPWGSHEVTVALGHLAAGSYELVAEYSNEFGATTSAITVVIP